MCAVSENGRVYSHHLGQTCYTTTDLALAQGTVLRGHFAEGAIGQTENADYSVDRTYVVTVDEEKEGEDKKKKITPYPE